MKISKKEQWERLNEVWSKCRACNIGFRARKHVLGKGFLSPDVVFIGEGPGKTEDIEGAPFVGRAGQLLDKAIQQARFFQEPEVVRPTVFFTNLVACRPCNVLGGPNREPLEREIINCRPRLLETLYILNPQCIVAVGGLARDWILPHARKDIKKYHILHPAYILRQGGESSPVWKHYVKSIQEVFKDVI